MDKLLTLREMREQWRREVLRVIAVSTVPMVGAALVCAWTLSAMVTVNGDALAFGWAVVWCLSGVAIAAVPLVFVSAGRLPTEDDVRVNQELRRLYTAISSRDGSD